MTRYGDDAVKLHPIAGFALACAVVMVAAAPASATPSWSVVGPVAGAEYGHLFSVSCTSTSSCFAAGVKDTTTVETRLVERWNGTKWSVVSTVNPSGASNSQFASVQCLSSTSCVAVGQYDAGSITKTLIERWNGTSWSIQPSPNPNAVAVSGLAGVRCISSTFCVAVGSYFLSTPDNSSEQTLVERWNGTSWQIVASPNRSSTNDSGLVGVSCTSSTNCFAVGHSDTQTATRTLVEHWNGSGWSIVTSPNPSNVAQTELSAVVCKSASNCFAAGSGRGTLIEHWNGSAWSITTSPNPAGANSASLTGLSCPSLTRCYAVGDFFAGNKWQRLVVTWNGSGWSLVSTPAPTGTIRSGFSGISCAATANCFAVGEYRLGPSRRPLIERFS